MPPDYSDLKSARTLHTEGDLANLREGETVSRWAKRWINAPDEDIYNIVPSLSVLRTCLMVLGQCEGGGVSKGYLECGDKIYKGRSRFYP